jgi:hypothetical protein
MPASITIIGGSEAEASIALLPNGPKQFCGVEVNWPAAAPLAHGSTPSRVLQHTVALTPTHCGRLAARHQPQAAQLAGHVGDAAALRMGDLCQGLTLALLDQDLSPI